MLNNLHFQFSGGRNSFYLLTTCVTSVALNSILSQWLVLGLSRVGAFELYSQQMIMFSGFRTVCNQTVSHEP